MKFAVSEIIDNFDNLVIDADAISKHHFKKRNILLTPHKGELNRLGVEANKESLMKFSVDYDVTILFKGRFITYFY